MQSLLSLKLSCRCTHRCILQIFSLLILFYSHAVSADTIYFKDGNQIHGKIDIVDYQVNNIKIRANKHTYIYPLDQIERYTYEENETPPYNWAARFTLSSVVYTLYEDEFDYDADIKARLDGYDFSALKYRNNHLAYEAGIYWGDTTTAESRYSEINLSAFTDARKISTIGLRGGVVYGWNIRNPGFSIYTGLGIYAERTKQYWTIGGIDTENLRGATAKFGLGYSWQTVAVDFWLNWRSDEPQGYLSNSSQAGLALTYKFGIGYQAVTN